MKRSNVSLVNFDYKSIVLLIVYLIPLNFIWSLDTYMSGSGGVMENSYGKENLPSYYLLGIEDEKLGAILEKRNNKTIGSVKFSNKYFYIAGGYRYQPLNAFYFLKDQGLYSAFRNYETGIIPQPIRNSYWFGLFPGKISFGIFYAKTLSKKKPGYYLDFYGYLSGGYLVETKEGFLLINMRKKVNQLFNTSFVSSVHSEILIKKRTKAGYFISNLFIPFYKINWFVFSEGGNKDRLGDIFLEDNKDFLVYTEVSYDNYSRFEVLRQTKENDSIIIGGTRLPFIFLKYGAISIGGRVYAGNVEARPAVEKIIQQGTGVYYEIWQKKFFFSTGVEKKQTGFLYEVRAGIKPSKGWRISINYFSLGATNYALYYARDISEYRKVGILNKKYLLELRITSPWVALSFSDSRTKTYTDKSSGKTIPEENQFYATVQFMYKF